MTALSASRPTRALARRALLVLAVAAAATGCSRFRRGELSEGPSYLIFANQSLEQADVFAIPASGDVTRIGTVMAGKTDTLTVRADLVSRSPLNIVARLLARSAAPSSGPVTLVPGEFTLITLPMDARLLTVLPGS